MILVGTSTPDTIYPSVACLVQKDRRDPRRRAGHQRGLRRLCVRREPGLGA